MIARIGRCLAPPVFADEQRTRIARVLNSISLTILAILVIVAVVTLLAFRTPAYGLAATGLMALLVVGLLFLIRRGYVRFASGLFASVLWAFDTLLIYGSGGIHSGVSPGYVAVTVLAGLLLGGRAAFGFAGLSGVAGLGMLYAESAGLLPPPLVAVDPNAKWLSLSANLVLAATLLYLATNSLNEALERARRDERFLAEANEGLKREVAERARMEGELRESEGRYRLLAENLTDVIWTTDMNLQLTYFSPSIANMGYTVEEAMGLSVEEFLTPASVQLAVDTLAREMAADETAPTRPFGSRILELEAYHGDGSTFWVEARMSFLRDAEGRPTGILGVARDITERKQAEAEREQLLAQIQEQALRVRQIIDTVPEGVLLLDSDERVVVANPVAEGHLSLLADAKVGDTLVRLGDRPLTELLTSPPRGLWHEVMADSRSFQVVARPFEDGPATGGWVLVTRDVTQQREIERRVRQQERLAAVGQLAAGIAHDFNNIMATIVLYAQMTARAAGVPAAVQERMETINGQAQHASKLIQQILDFSRRAVLERQPLDLAVLLDTHVGLLRRTLPEDIEIELVYGSGPDEADRPDKYAVHADPTRMQQMVTNLALNARDAMPEGGRLCIELERIEVRPKESPLLPEMEPGEWIRLVVSDTGTGIPPDVLPHIFEPFFTTKAPLGSGLGLAQVYGIVAQHKGRIDLDTQWGHGTTFSIYLPAYRPKSSAAPLPGELSTLPRGQGETVLVVEDDTAVRRALVESLEELNYQVVEAASGRAALEVLEHRGVLSPGSEQGIALVLSDVVMPGMGGIALWHALRERGLTVPVIMLTGHPLEKELEALRAQGMMDWLPKPPSLEQLADMVARALRGGAECRESSVGSRLS